MNQTVGLGPTAYLSGDNSFWPVLRVPDINSTLYYTLISNELGDTLAFQMCPCFPVIVENLLFRGMDNGCERSFKMATESGTLARGLPGRQFPRTALSFPLNANTAPIVTDRRQG